MNVTTMMVMIGANTVGLNKGISDMYRMKRAVSVAANGMNQSLMSTNMMLDKTNLSLQRLKANADITSMSIATLGRNLTMFVSVPLGLFGVSATKIFSEVEFNLSKVTGLVGIAAEQTAQWKSEMNSLSMVTGKGPKELSEALYYVTTGGIRGAETMDVMTVSAKAAATGLGDVKDIADVLVSAMNAYGKENLDAAAAADILVRSVKEGKAEASQLVTAFGVVTPIASKLGISYDQVGAGLAAMTRTGTTAATSATQLRRILFTLLKPTQQVEQALHTMGTTSQEMRNIFRFEGLLPGLLKIQELTNKWGEEMMGQVFPNIRAFAGAVDILGENLNKNREIFNSIANATGSLDKAFSVVSETFRFKLNVALSQGRVTLENIGAVIAKQLIPVIESFGNAVKNIGDWFTSLSPALQNLIVKFSGIVFAIGPIVLIFSGLKSLLLPVFTLLKKIALVPVGLLAKQMEVVNEVTKKQITAQNVLNRTQYANYANYQKIIATQKLANGLKQKALTASIQSTNAAFAEAQAQEAITVAKQRTIAANRLYHKTNLHTIQALEVAKARVLKYDLALLKAQHNLTNAQRLGTLGIVKKSVATGYLNYLQGLQIKAKEALRIAEEKATVAAKKSTLYTNQLAVAKEAEILRTKALRVLKEQELKAQMNGIAAKKLEQKAAILNAEALKKEAAALQLRNKAYEKAVITNATYMASGKTHASARAAHLASIGKNYKGSPATFVPVGGSDFTKNAQQMAAANSAAKKAAQNVAQSTGIMSKAFKGLGIAAMSLGGVLKGLWAIIAANPMTSIFAVVGGVYLLKKSKEQLTNIQKTENEIREKTAEAISGEVGKVNAYISIANNERLSRERRLEALEKLIEINPAYFNGLDLESTKLGKLTKAGEVYNNNLRERIRLQVLSEMYEENFAKRERDIVSGADKKTPWQFDVVSAMNNMNIGLTLFRRLLNDPSLNVEKDMASVMQKLNTRQFEERDRLITQQMQDRSASVAHMQTTYTYLSNTIEDVYKKEAELQNKSKNKTKENREEIEKSLIAHNKTKEAVYQQMVELNKLAKEELAFKENVSKTWSTEAQDKFLESTRTILSFTEDQLTQLRKIFKDTEGETNELATAILTLFNNLRDGVQTVENLSKLGMISSYMDKISSKVKLLENAINELADASKNLISIDDQRIQKLKMQYDIYKTLLDLIKTGDAITNDWAEANEFWMNQTIDMDMSAKKLGTSVATLKNELGEGVVTQDYLTNLVSVVNTMNQAELATLKLNSKFSDLETTIEISNKRLDTLDDLLNNLSNVDIQLPEDINTKRQSVLTAGNKTYVEGILKSMNREIDEANKKAGLFGETWTELDMKSDVYSKTLRRLLNINIQLFDNDGLEKYREAVLKVSDALQNVMAAEQRRLAIYEQMKEVIETIGDAYNMLTDRRISALKKQYDKEIALAGENQEKRTKLEEEFAAKRAKLLRKQAVFEKALSIVKIAIKTAEGVINYGSNPATAGLVPFIVGLGMAQAAIVAATPIPEMAKGGVIPAGYPNDTYPAMLSSGEVVIPPNKLPEFNRGPAEIKVVVEGQVKGKDLYYVMKEFERRYSNTY